MSPIAVALSEVETLGKWGWAFFVTVDLFETVSVDSTNLSVLTSISLAADAVIVTWKIKSLFSLRARIDLCKRSWQSATQHWWHKNFYLSWIVLGWYLPIASCDHQFWKNCGLLIGRERQVEKHRCGIFLGVENADELLSHLKVEIIMWTFHTASEPQNICATGHPI